MLFNLDSANLMIIENVIPIGIPTKEAKAEIETHLVIVEITKS